MQTGSGQHWFVIARGPQGIEIFDSLATENISLLEKLLPAKEVTLNNIQLQSISSSLCGEFCLYYATLRVWCMDESFEEILTDYFSEDKDKNDIIVKNFVETGEIVHCPDGS